MRNVLTFLLGNLFILSFLFLYHPIVFAAYDLNLSGKANTLERLQQLGVAEGVNGKIYVIGGYNDSGVTGHVEEYDPNTDIWTYKTSMPTSRGGLGVIAASNGKIYAIGGQASGGLQGIVGTVEEYNPLTNTWVRKNSMPTPRTLFGIALGSDGKIYTIGGLVNDSNPYSYAVEAYDPTTNTWVDKSLVPTRRLELTASSVGEKIYAIGGANSSGALSTVEQYDIQTNSWTTKASLPIPAYYLESAVDKYGKIYVLGGSSCFNNQACGFIYDPSLNTWSPTDFPFTLVAFGIVPVLDGIYIVDGLGTSGAVNRVYKGLFPTAPPVIKAILTSTPLTPVNTQITTSANFNDLDTTESHTGVWDWGDGNTSSGTISEANGSGIVFGNHTYTTTGLYSLTLTLTDNNGGTGSFTYKYVVVYDPTGGFITGSGKYVSQEGWDKLNSQTLGDVKFEIHANYTKSNSIPTGNAKWIFKTRDVAFESTSYQWLIVSGVKATLKGNGILNGVEGYTFLVSTINEDSIGNQSLIRFQIKDSLGHVVYDTQMGDSDTADPTTLITSGTIKIH